MGAEFCEECGGNDDLVNREHTMDCAIGRELCERKIAKLTKALLRIGVRLENEPHSEDITAIRKILNEVLQR